MEYDRYQQNSTLFVIGIIALLLSLSLFAFGFYIVPYLVWNWGYGVPGFILTWREWFKEGYGFTTAGASWLIFLIFIIPAAICGFISYLISNHIDNQIYGINQEKTEKTSELGEEVKASLSFGFKILLLIILLLVVLSLIQWFFAIV